jgi:hypothetical protein
MNMDIFDKIADDFISKKASLSQPLRLRRDYGEEEITKEAQMTKEKFAERMENDPEFAEKWNANKKTKKQAGEDEIDRISSEFISERVAYAKGSKGSKDFKKYHGSNKDFAETWDGQIEANKDMIKSKGKSDSKKIDLSSKPKGKSKGPDISAMGRLATESDIDRIVSEFISERVAYAKGEEGRKQLEEKKKNDPEFAEKWEENTVHSKEEMDEKMGKSAGHHDHHRGSYMSVQHLAEMQDLIAGISDMVHRDEELPNWVDSKIAHIHQNLLDLVGYFQYGNGYHTHED